MDAWKTESHSRFVAGTFVHCQRQAPQPTPLLPSRGQNGSGCWHEPICLAPKFLVCKTRIRFLTGINSFPRQIPNVVRIKWAPCHRVLFLRVHHYTIDVFWIAFPFKPQTFWASRRIFTLEIFYHYAFMAKSFSFFCSQFSQAVPAIKG